MSKLTLATAALLASGFFGWTHDSAHAQGKAGAKNAAPPPPPPAVAPPIPLAGYSGYGAYPGFFPGGYWSYSSTAAEGFQHGFADVVRSAGLNHLYNAEALKELEKAQSADIVNREKAVDAYFEMRRANAHYRAMMRGPTPTEEDLTRYAKQRSPGQLSYLQLDPVSGELSWPALLRGKKLADERQMIDDVFIKRAQAGGQRLSEEKYKALNQAVQRLMETLQSQVREAPTNEYLQARDFLNSLALEVRNLRH